MTLCLYAEHTEAAVVVVKRDSLYDAGDLLGRGSALWHSSGHSWGFNFATDGCGVDDPPGSRLWGSLAAGWVRVGIPGLKCRVKCRSRPEHKVRAARAAVTPDGRERDGAGYSRTQPAKCTPEL